MLPVLAFLLGFAFGWHRAARRNGDRLDRLQYGAAHGILFAVIAFVLIVVAERILVA